MLQRIQSVFLLLASACMLVASVTRIIVFTCAEGTLVVEAMGMSIGDEQKVSTWGLFVLGAISSVLALITVFQYKKRMLQIRFSIFNAILMLGFYLYLGFMIYYVNRTVPLKFETIGIGITMPIIAFILTILAIRKIGADEALVRSLDRLR